MSTRLHPCPRTGCTGSLLPIEGYGLSGLGASEYWSDLACSLCSRSPQAAVAHMPRRVPRLPRGPRHQQSACPEEQRAKDRQALIAAVQRDLNHGFKPMEAAQRNGASLRTVYRVRNGRREGTGG